MGKKTVKSGTNSVDSSKTNNNKNFESKNSNGNTNGKKQNYEGFYYT